MDRIDNLDVDALAERKQLDADFLRREFALYDRRWYGLKAVGIPYRDATGAHVYDKVRLARGGMRYAQRGCSPIPYGLDRLAHVPKGATVWLVEGESDVWAASYRGMNAIGIGGASMWRPEWATILKGYECVLFEEPDPAGAQLVVRVAWSMPDARTVRGSATNKDLCQLHETQGDALDDALAECLRTSVPLRSRALALRAEQPTLIRPAAPRWRIGSTSQSSALSDALGRARSRPIEEIVSGLGHHLIGRGRERAMLCPFHEDKNHPSMRVNVERGVWTCFTCGAGGDGIEFVKRLRALTFAEAVREVAS